MWENRANLQLLGESDPSFKADGSIIIILSLINSPSLVGPFTIRARSVRVLHWEGQDAGGGECQYRACGATSSTLCSVCQQAGWCHTDCGGFRAPTPRRCSQTPSKNP